MSAVQVPLAGPVPGPAAGSGVRDSYVTEFVKLRAQLSVRVLAVVVIIAPSAFAILLKVQSGTPSDALFGAWVHSSGFAISLVVLGFAGSWGFPIIAGVLGGDMFSSEDRQGTWKTILTRSCTREDVFAGKLLAAGTAALALGLLLALASIVGGFVLVGPKAMVDLSGALRSPGRLLVLTVVAWVYCLVPLLAYTSLAVLFSVVARNGIVGVLGPLLVALLSQLVGLIGRGVVAHLLLIGSAFDGWHGLFVSRPFLGPLLVSLLVCCAWIAVCAAVSWRVLSRRDFLGSGSQRRASWSMPLALAGGLTAIAAVLALTANLGPTAVTAYRVSAAIGPEFNNLTLLQQALIGRHAPPGARLDVLPNCMRPGTRAIGPGDWSCSLYVYLPQLNAVPFQQTQVEYEVSVQANGCFKAQSPPSFIGGATMAVPGHPSTINPLFVVYGCFNIL